MIRYRVWGKVDFCLDFDFIKQSLYIFGFGLKLGLASFSVSGFEFGVGFASFSTSVLCFVKFPNNS